MKTQEETETKNNLSPDKVSNETSKIYGEYFQLTKEYTEKYGEKTILLMQIGSFFEMYGVKNQESEDMGSFEQVAQICQFTISEKKSLYQKHPLWMAGFPEYRIDKYLQKITEGGYTAVVFVQEKNEKNTKRIFHSVHSPGTFVSYDTDSSQIITNHIMCIWMEKNTNLLNQTVIFHCGISVINIYTGKSNMFQYQTPFLNNHSTYDELERAVSMYSPSEVILISPFDTQQIDSILQFTGIKTSMIHRINNREPLSDKIKNVSQQKYIKTILSSFYGPDVLDICVEFQQNEMATQSFCYLLDFIREHNPLLIKKIDLPEWNHTSNRVLLLNHTIAQLNIINGETKCGHLSSVLSFLNKCSCAMGKRRFASQMANPTFCEEWLETEYDIIDWARTQSDEWIRDIRNELRSIKDMEKICRQMVLQKIYPGSIYHLYESIRTIQKIHSKITPVSIPMVSSYFVKEGCIDTHCSRILPFITHCLKIEKCQGIQSVTQFEENIICPGISPVLDAYLNAEEKNRQLLDTLREHFNQWLNTSEKTTGVEYVKEHVTEKSGKSLVITKKRGSRLKTLLAQSKEPLLVWGGEKIQVSDIKLVNSTTSNDEIVFPLLNKITRELLCSKEKINKEIAETYHRFILELDDTWLPLIENLSRYVGKLDVVLNKAFVSQEYHYCRPILDSSANKSYVEAADLRHVLIEHINTQEIYVPNDCRLGSGETDGILLLGINMAGKSSYIKSVGVALIMAQSGCYVPASAFRYKPYQRIFSRIVSNDNMFKNLSLFAVEMTELRTILKNSDENSLVLLDELSNGSETQSSVSILMATLMHLSQQTTSFICSTHFHEVLQFDELRVLPNIRVNHLLVYYDRERDALVYDRRLKEGSGPSSYGLEVCKSLYFPVAFLNQAMEIRNKYHPENRGILSNPFSAYNAQKIRDLCEICHSAMGQDIHHLREQKTADDNNYIDHFHKNHPANLINICESCHKKEHASEEIPKKTRKTKTTRGMQLV